MLNYSTNSMGRAFSLVAWVCAASLALIANSAQAKTDWAAEISLRAIESELDLDEGEELDSSGIGIRGDISFQLEPSERTRIRFEAEAGAFDYRDEDRDTRESYGGSITVSHDISDHVEVRLRARRIENIAVLEANSADQTSIGVRLQWQDGNDRVRLYADYREREYDLANPATGDGYRIAAQYNRRIGSYHWFRIDMRHEEMESSESTRRNFERRVIKATYNRPIAKRLQLRPSIEFREWDYEARIAQGDPEGDLRADRFVAPGLGLVYGRSSRGFFARVNTEYRIRSSNDERFGKDGIRAGVTVGFRI